MKIILALLSIPGKFLFIIVLILFIAFISYYMTRKEVLRNKKEHRELMNLLDSIKNKPGSENNKPEEKIRFITRLRKRP
jgi:hypothetical protein